MLERIEKGEAEGIIVWHPDRLARNSVDGGRIIYLLDRNILKDLQFATFSFENNSQGKFMLSIIFGYSKYYVDSLSENVKRGNRAKVALGWRPSAAPIGYLNDKNTRTIIPDPARFDLVRRLFDLSMTGSYSLRALREETMRWGLRTLEHRRLGGSYLTISGIHRMLTNPFYTGVFLWNNQLHRGAHQAMVSMEEFERVRKLLRRPGKSTPKKLDFPFTGLIRCGECGFMITAEIKTNRYGSRYTYYHCSKRRLDYRCRQPSVRAEVLEEMIKKNIAAISLSSPIHDYLIRTLDEADGLGEKQRQKEKRSVEKAIQNTTDWQRNLQRLQIRGRISQEEFDREEQEIQKEKYRLQESLSQIEQDMERFEFEGMLNSFSKQAISRFVQGDSCQKRLIVRAISSNTVLKDKILRIEARKPFIGVPENLHCSSWLAEGKHVPTEGASLETFHALLAGSKDVTTSLNQECDDLATLPASQKVTDDAEILGNWNHADLQRMKKNIREVRRLYLRKDPELMEGLHIIREIMREDFHLPPEN